MMGKIIKLGDIINLQNGYAFKSKEYSSDGHFVMRITNVQKGYISNHNPRYIKIKSHTNLEKFILKEKDILISLTGDVGRVGIIKKKHLPCVLNQRVAKVDIINESIINKNFLFLFLNSDIFIKKVEKISHGTAQSNVSTKDILNINLNLPSLKEQQRIVVKLDTAFVEIDKMIITEELKKKNTITLEENLLHLLLENINIDKSTYTLSKLIDMGWIEGHLDGNHGSDYPRKNEFVENGVPYLSANCIVDGKIQINNQKYLTEERASKIRKGIAKNNDILFAHNATVGPTAILKTDYPKIILGTSLTYYRCKKNIIHPEYLMAYMTSRYFQSQYKSVMRQATRNQVPITKQRKFSFIIPDYEQQVKIAKKADIARENVKIILNSISEKVKNLNSLKSTILTRELQNRAA